MTKSINDYPTDGFPVPWATWIPDRRPEFKVHSDLGRAKNAIGAEMNTRGGRMVNGRRENAIRGGVLYRMVEGKWIVAAIIEPGTYKSDHLIYANARKWNKQPGITTVIEEHPFEG